MQINALLTILYLFLTVTRFRRCTVIAHKSCTFLLYFLDVIFAVSSRCDSSMYFHKSLTSFFVYLFSFFLPLSPFLSFSLYVCPKTVSRIFHNVCSSLYSLKLFIFLTVRDILMYFLNTCALTHNQWIIDFSILSTIYLNFELALFTIVRNRRFRDYDFSSLISREFHKFEIIDHLRIQFVCLRTEKFCDIFSSH